MLVNKPYEVEIYGDSEEKRYDVYVNCFDNYGEYQCTEDYVLDDLFKARQLAYKLGKKYNVDVREDVY